MKIIPQGSKSIKSFWLLFFGLLFIQFFRLVELVRVYGVNILYWDQWDFLEPIIRGIGPLDFFRTQQGTTRLGIAGLVSWLSAHIGGMNSRFDAWVMI